jgi:hypothetical protein
MKYVKSRWLGLRVLFIAVLTFVQGCTLSAPQFDSALNLARTLISPESDSGGDGPAVWLASVGGRGAAVNPYTTNGLVVFANADGDAIAFDGWIVRSVSGFGLSAAISISGKDGVRTFSDTLGQFSTTCDSWVRNDRVWSQVCGNGEGSIELNETGNIERMSISLGERLGNVTLQVVK